MIRILQQDNRITKIIFAVIIGFAVITMVITLVPGVFDNASVNDANVFATVREPGLRPLLERVVQYRQHVLAIFENLIGHDAATQRLQ